MSFIRTSPPESAAGELAAMYERQQSAWGYVPNYAKVFCHRPEVMARWGQLLAEIKRPMERRRFELVTFVAAHELRHTACTLAHGRALEEFFSQEEVLAIAESRCNGILDAAERAMLAFARKVARDAVAVTEGDVAALRDRGFDDPEIFDIAAAAAGRAFFTKLLDALGVRADSPFASLEAAFGGRLTVGRAVDRAAVATMPSAPRAAP